MVLSSAQIEKHTNKQYDEIKYLNKYIKDQIKEAEIIGDVAIVDGYAFELDRSVPKIGEYVGKKDELTFPEVSVSEIEYSSDYKTAKFTITAKEEKNGISKIEIIQYGKVLDTFEYGNSKEEISKEYSVQQNGTYTVKVYSKLKATEEVEVTDLVMAVEYSPNGNEEYKKSHTTKITVKETTDRVKSLKYQWSKELTVPEESTFTQNCSNNSAITGKDMTGTYYLWTLLEAESGKKNICRSEGFKFDNTLPTGKLITEWIEEETRNRLKITVTNLQDEHSGVNNNSIKLYVTPENRAKEEKNVSLTNDTGEVIIDGLDRETLTIIDLNISDNAENETSIQKHAGRIYCVKNGDLVNGNWYFRRRQYLLYASYVRN